MAQSQSRDENERGEPERGRDVAVTVTRVDLQHAAAGLIPEARVELLWSALLARHRDAPEAAAAPAAADVAQGVARSRFDLLHVAYYFGALLVISAMGWFMTLDQRMDEDYAFWGYLFGLAAFWGGLSLMESGSEFGRILYCLVNVGLMIVSVVLERRAFLVFGALGVFGYLGYLSYRVFKSSLLFPFVLTFIGIVIIYLGVLYQRHGPAIERAVRALVPDAIRQTLRPTRTPR
jgi:hypothetical protein